MASLVVALYLACLVLGNEAQTPALKFSSFSSVHRESDVASVETGDTLTLKCLFTGKLSTRLYWYKQTLGQKPRLISIYHVFTKNGTFYDAFKNNPRFALHTENNENHLTITDLRISDSASYYCARSLMFIFEFAEGIIVNVKGSGLNVPIVIHQSTSETIQPGGSVTLHCTVQTGTCEGEHRVYWFKNSVESHPGLIYSHEGRNDSCERKSDTQTHTCVYNMPMKSLNLSHAGTYYCAVASCGHILFGNGTKLGMDDEVHLVYFWRGASAFTSVVVVLLAFSVCVMKRNNCQSSETQARCSPPSSGNPDGYQEAETLYYAALSSVPRKRSENERDQTWSKCLYHSVKK